MGACGGDDDAAPGADAAPVADAAPEADAGSAGECAVLREECDEVVTANQTGAAFSARLTEPGRTICLADGVVVSGPVQFGADRITVAVLPGAEARIENTGQDAAITVDHRSGIELVGVSIVASHESITSGVLLLASTDVELRCATVECEAENCSIVLAVNGSSFAVRRSTLIGNVDRGGPSRGLEIGDSQAQVADTTVTSMGEALLVEGQSDVVVTDSDLSGLDPVATTDEPTVYVFGGEAHLDLSSSHVLTAGHPAVGVGLPDCVGSPATVELGGNLIHKKAGTPAGSYSPMTSGCPSDIFLSGAANTFCDEGDSVDDGEFGLPLIDGTYDTDASTIDDVTQNGPDDCSAFP